jgi:hypothetical protein
MEIKDIGLKGIVERHIKLRLTNIYSLIGINFLLHAPRAYALAILST